VRRDVRGGARARPQIIEHGRHGTYYPAFLEHFPRDQLLAIKLSTTVRNALYRPYGDDDRPSLSPETGARLRARYGPEVAAVDTLLGTNLGERWAYGSATDDVPVGACAVPSTESTG
jgi:hypothetical protein